MAGARNLLTRLFAIDASSVRIAVRGFRVVDARITDRLELIGKVFLQGYHLGLDATNTTVLCRRLDETPNEQRGFAYEGAAMGLGVQDIVLGRRWSACRQLLQETAAQHAYLIHVGIGWAIAAIPWTRYRVGKAVAALDPLLRWLAIDGYGFHHGYFYWRKYVDAGKQCRCLTGYQRRAFDQGLGRCIWFVTGADPSQILRNITALSPARRGDVWSGVGLACSYAGGVDSDVIYRLRDVAGIHRAELSLGAAFAAKARSQAANPAPHTETACSVLCGLSAARAAQVSDECLRQVATVKVEERYEAWRQVVRSRFASQTRETATFQGGQS